MDRVVVGERHPVAAAEVGLESEHVAGHVVRRAPGDQRIWIEAGAVEDFARRLDEPGNQAAGLGKGVIAHEGSPKSLDLFLA